MSSDVIMVKCAHCHKLFKPSVKQLSWHYRRRKIRCPDCIRHPQGEDGILVPEKVKEKLKRDFYAKTKNN